MEKGKYIVLPIKEKRRLATDFGVSLVAVYDALKFKTRSSRSNAIRAAAMQRGGMVYHPENFGKTFERAVQRD
jgi:hypothetical protein